MCLICGVLVGGGSLHIAYHVERGEAGPFSVMDDCPIDGSPIAVADNDGVLWSCGHAVKAAGQRRKRPPTRR